jgi:hypothetical protein
VTFQWLGQTKDQIPLVQPAPLTGRTVPTNRCDKPAQYATWEQYWDAIDPGWVSYDYRDPTAISATARCPGAYGGAQVVTQRFPRDPTNRYFVAFRRMAAERLLCACCNRCPPALRAVPGGCPSGQTRVDVSVHRSGTSQLACSICVPDGDLAATGGTIQRLCQQIAGLVPGSKLAT